MSSVDVERVPRWLREAIEPDPLLAGAAPVPEQFRDATLASIPSNPLKKLLRTYGENFLEHAGNGVAPLLLGPPGTYKSYAAAVLLKQIHARLAITTHWCTVPVQFTKLERTRFTPQTDEQIEQWKQSPFLVLDDFALVRLNSWQHDVLIEIAMSRFESRRPTLWTGNVVLQPGQTDVLVEVVGAQLSRRILERSTGFRLYVQTH